MNKSYRAEPTHPGYGGEASFEAYAKRDDVAALPGIDVAMWHEDFKPYEDVSRFNDIYYDLYDIEEDLGDDVMVLYLFGAMHNIAFIVFMVLPFTPLWKFLEDSEWGIDFLPPYIFFLILCVVFFCFAKSAFNNIGVRLNRQAQLIHFALGKNDYYHVPWKNIRPFTYHERSNKLVLGYPLPDEQREKFEDDSLERLYGKEPPHLGIEFTAGDNTGIFDNLHRLEFIRRYMELGVAGIKPPEGVEPKKMTTQVLTPRIYKFKTVGDFLFWCFSAGMYWPAGGPLIDRWVRYEARKFKWPEEVERLCTPGADLTGFDTRPVRPSEVLFYRFTGFEFEIVDAEGRKVTGAGLDFLQDRSLYPKED